MINNKILGQLKFTVKYCWYRMLLGSWNYYKVSGSSSIDIPLISSFLVARNLQIFSVTSSK